MFKLHPPCIYLHTLISALLVGQLSKKPLHQSRYSVKRGNSMFQLFQQLLRIAFFIIYSFSCLSFKHIGVKRRKRGQKWVLFGKTPKISSVSFKISGEVYVSLCQFMSDPFWSDGKNHGLYQFMPLWY